MFEFILDFLTMEELRKKVHVNTYRNCRYMLSTAITLSENTTERPAAHTHQALRRLFMFLWILEWYFL